MLRKRIRGNMIKALIFLGLTLCDGLLVFFSYYFLLGSNPSYGNLWYLAPIILLSNIYYTYTYGGGMALTLFVMLMNQWPLFFVVMTKPITIFVPLLAIAIKFTALHCFNKKKRYYFGSAAGRETLTYNCTKGIGYSSLTLKNFNRAKNKSITFETTEDFWAINSKTNPVFQSVECMDGNPIDNRFAANAKKNHHNPIVGCGRRNKLVIFFTNDKSMAQDYLQGFSPSRGEDFSF